MNGATFRDPQSTPYKLRREVDKEPIVFDGLHPELCPELARNIIARSKHASFPSLNVGGWKSTEGFFSWIEPEVQELQRALIGLLGAKPIGWAMINRAGSEHRRHQHRIALLAGVYYVTAGDPAVPTIYELADKSEIEIEPSPGRLVLCSGETWHRVPRYDGQKPRITIAFDVRR